MPDTLDGALLTRFVQGDEAAFELVFRQFERDVFNWVLRIVRDRAAAEDLVVEAFWRAYRSRARFDPARSFGAWMRRIATNVALDHLQQRRLPIDPDVPVDALVAQRQPDADVDRAIRAAFRTLPPYLSVVAVLALVEGLPYAEIADALDVPLGTVKSRVFRATRALREELTRQGVTP